jgi:alpha-tubulin suppressor-like RCC1 family protein
MSRNTNTGRSGKTRVTGPVNNETKKSDVTTGRSISNTHKRTGPTDKEINKFNKVLVPTVSPGEGKVTKNFNLTLTNPQSSVTYKYTIDGSSPTGAGAQTIVNNQISLALTGSPGYLNVKIYGYRNDYSPSEITDLEYNIKPTQDVVVVPQAGSIPDNQLVKLNVESEATGYYTLDGSTPSGDANTTSTKYTGPFVMNFTNSSSVVLKTIAEKHDHASSSITTGTFTLDSAVTYGGPYDGVRDLNGKLVTYSPTGDRIPFPSKIFMSTTEGLPIERKVSFWGTDYYVENNRPSTVNNYTSLKAGQNHAIALTKSGTVVAWGDNSLNQTTLSDANLTTSGKITYIDAGDSHNLSLTSDNDVIAWGSNAQGQITIPTSLKAIRIAAGGEHSIALKADRTLVGWGENSDGQINFPLNLNDVIEISAGQNHSAALVGYGSKTCQSLDYDSESDTWIVSNKSKSIGKAVAWGINDMNQKDVPNNLANGAPDLIAISCGGNHTLTLDANGNVSGWGDNGHGQITIPTLNEIDGTKAHIVSIDAGFSHSLALSKNGTIFAWGSNQHNQTNITNLLSKSALIAGGDNYSLAFGLEPSEYIYYNVGNLDPSILYTGSIDVSADTTFKAISINKTSQAASNIAQKSYAQQKLNAIQSAGAISSRGTSQPLETSVLNPATFHSKRLFAVKLDSEDVDKKPSVTYKLTHPGHHTAYATEDLTNDDATEKRFSSTLITGDVNKPYDGDKTIDNYAAFYPGGYVGYKFDEAKRITQLNFATNADDFHKLGAGLIQGSNDNVTWHDIDFFSNKFPDNYPAFLSLDGQALDRIATLEMTSKGTGYTEDPIIRFVNDTDEEGQDAKAKALFSPFSLAGFSMINNGSGYTSVPTVNIASVHGGAGAAGTAVLSSTSVVHGISLDCGSCSKGNGYTTAPTVTVQGGHTDANTPTTNPERVASGIAHLTPTKLTGIEIIENKVPYRTSPTVNFAGGGGINAAAVAHLSSFVVGQINPSGILIGNADEKPPFGYHVYDGVIVPGIGAPTIGNFGGGYYGNSDDDPTGLYKLDHFDLTNLGTGYTSAPSVSLDGGLLTKTGQPYAIEFEVVRRGPVSGAPETEVADWEITNKDYLSGYFVNPKHAGADGTQQVTSGHHYWDSNFATEMAAAWNNLSNVSQAGSPVLGPLRYFFNHYNDHEFDRYHTIDTRPYHLKFHKDSARTQKIMVTGGGGAGMSGYVELRNHNELLGFDDSDTLLDKLIALNTHSDYRNSRLDYDALDNNNISYEELLWSTPTSKGGVLPDEDATLIPYKLHITEAGQGYTGAPIITEEFDRSFPGMMFMLESGGLKLHEDRPSPLPLTGGHNENGLYTNGQPEGYTLLWGSGECNGNDAALATGPFGTCSESLTGQYDTVYSNNSYLTGHYLKNKYLSTNNKFYRYWPQYFDSNCYDTHFPLQFEVYAPTITGTAGVHTNDMNNANSAARLNFENKLADNIKFAAIMPEHSEVDSFLASGSLDRVEITNMGSHYSSTPTIVFAGGTTATAATGEALTSKTVDSVSMTNAGSAYRAFPDITLVGGGGADAAVVGTKSASEITGMLLVSGGKNFTNSPTIDVSGGGAGVTSKATAKCRLPVALSSANFTNNNFYDHYRILGQGDNALITSQINELEFYSGDNRVSKYSNRKDHALAIKSNGELMSWGDNSNSQLMSSGVTNALEVSAGDKHSLVLKNNGTVIAFGNNDYGQCNIPSDLNNVITVSAGENHSLGLLAGGIVRAWGRNHSGQANVPSSLSSYQSGNNGAISIKAGNNHSLALRGDGSVLAWGATEASTVPADLTRVREIAAGNRFSLALRENGDVISWGNGYGADVPTGLKDVVSIAANNDHVIALQVDGAVTGWGKVYDGSNYVNLSDTIPHNLNSGIGVFAGKDHGAILKSDGSLLVFGSICASGTEQYYDGVVPSSFGNSHCCGTTGFVTFDLGSLHSGKLDTNENLSYRSINVGTKTSADAAFPPDNASLQNKVRIVTQVTGLGYLSSDPTTGDYPLVKLAPVVSPETNVNYGPSITVSNWDQDSIDNLVVRYTTDGTDPKAGNSYSYISLPPNSGDFLHTIPAANFNNSTTLKVYAFSDVYLDSDIVSYQRQQLAAPTANITATGTNVLYITMNGSAPSPETRDVNIYYTLDGSAPTSSSYLYTNPITLQGNSATVKAFSSLVGYIDSSVTTETHP